MSVTKDGAPIPLVFGTHIEFHLTQNSAGGTAGCQSEGGVATISDGRLHVVDIGMTLIGCDAEHQAQDDWFARFLASTPAITFDGDRVRLESGGTVIDLVDKASVEPDPLANSQWLLQSVAQGDGVEVPVPARVEATLDFGDQGVSSWYMGCAGGASYYARSGTNEASLQFIPFPTDRSPQRCGGQGEALVEESLRSVLSSTDVPFRVDATTLTLTGSDRTLVFKRRQAG